MQEQTPKKINLAEKAMELGKKHYRSWQVDELERAYKQGVNDAIAEMKELTDKSLHPTYIMHECPNCHTKLFLGEAINNKPKWR